MSWSGTKTSSKDGKQRMSMMGQTRNASDSDLSKVTNNNNNNGAEASSSSAAGAEDNAKQQRQLEAVLREIVDTEIDYCKDLDVLSEVFFLPLQIRSKEIGVTKADVEVLFSNLELLRNLHQTVMQEFEELKASGKDGTPCGVGTVLMKMSQYFKMYTQYSTNQPAALRRLEYLLKNVPGFRKFVDIATADPRCRGLQFGGYLIKPVQRVCKYPLLLRELLKYLDPSHEDYELIGSLKSAIDKVVDAINEGKRTVEIQEKVVRYSQCFENLDFDLVTPTRLYVRHSDTQLRHSLSGTAERRTLFLFNDLIIVARETSSKPTFQIKTKMPFEQSRFIVLSEQEKTSNAFEILFEDKRFIFCMSSKALQAEWIADLRQLTRELKLAQIRAHKNRLK